MVAATASRLGRTITAAELPTLAASDADLADLRESGYLAAFVPAEFGGAGLSLEEVCAEQTRLAKASPATALGINMHQIIVGLGRHLVRAGNTRGEQILREAAAGELFGFGISEPGNDLVLFGSDTEAAPDGECAGGAQDAVADDPGRDGRAADDVGRVGCRCLG